MFYPYDPLDGVKCSTNPRGSFISEWKVFAICVKFLRNYCCWCHWFVYTLDACVTGTAVTWWWQLKSRQGISLSYCVIYPIANCGFDVRQHGSHLPHSNAPPCVVRVTVRVARKGRRVRVIAKTGNDLDLFRENAPGVATRECATRALRDKNPRRHLVSGRHHFDLSLYKLTGLNWTTKTCQFGHFWSIRPSRTRTMT